MCMYIRIHVYLFLCSSINMYMYIKINKHIDTYEFVYFLDMYTYCIFWYILHM